MSKWPGIRILKFLEIYEKHECLWNHKCDGYKNKPVKDKAFDDIIDELKVPNLTANDIKLKIKSIRTTYKRELTTLLRSAKQDKPYEPKLFWFKKADSFLRPVSLARRGCSLVALGYESDPQIKESNDLNDEETVQFYKSEPPIQIVHYEETSQKEDENSSKANEVENFNTNGIPEESVTVSYDVTSSSNIVRTDTVSKLREMSNVEPATNNGNYENRRNFNDDSIKYDTSYNISNIDPHNPGTPVPLQHYQQKYEEDEYVMFCRGVAAQLRAISDPYSRSVAKFKIQQILFEAETGHYMKNTQTSFLATNMNTTTQ